MQPRTLHADMHMQYVHARAGTRARGSAHTHARACAARLALEIAGIADAVNTPGMRRTAYNGRLHTAEDVRENMRQVTKSASKADELDPVFEQTRNYVTALDAQVGVRKHGVHI